MTLDRRSFLTNSTAMATGLSGMARWFDKPQQVSLETSAPAGFGPLIPDPAGILDLPKGFTYTTFSIVGERMDDGLLVPAAHDGMAAFAGPRGKTIVIRNHELSLGSPNLGPFGKNHEWLRFVDKSKIYDRGLDKPLPGGTTTMVIDNATGKLEEHYLSLIGTCNNCAGGPTPWNTWISCEESTFRAGTAGFAKDHGYNFEVPARRRPGLVDPKPLKAMGRFNHEAIVVDPNTGIIYQSEDRSDSAFFRFIPHQRGRLHLGGQLQALVFRDQPCMDTRNWEGSPTIPIGAKFEVEWINVEDIESPKDDMRYQVQAKGAAIFARGEGLCWGHDSIYFGCTTGGKKLHGQIWRYQPIVDNSQALTNSRGYLQLFIEPDDPTTLDMADNLTVSPNGDLYVCEDGAGEQFIVGITPTGASYKFAYNAKNNSEFAGATFSPDGKTLFANIQRPGITLAIRGPWDKRAKPSKQR